MHVIGCRLIVNISSIHVMVGGAVMVMVSVMVDLFCDTLEDNGFLALHLFRSVIEWIAWLYPAEYIRCQERALSGWATLVSWLLRLKNAFHYLFCVFFLSF